MVLMHRESVLASRMPVGLNVIIEPSAVLSLIVEGVSSSGERQLDVDIMTNRDKTPRMEKDLIISVNLHSTLKNTYADIV
jgi:hypothetical protein